VNAQVIILEEFAFMNVQCFHQVVIPLISMKISATIGISTIDPSPDNFVTDLKNRNVIKFIPIELACETCKKAGEGESCKHRRHLAPPTLGGGRYELTRKLYPEEEGGRYAVEMLGIVKQEEKNCFNHNLLHELFANRKFDPNENQHRYLFITIDPCGGSVKPSDSSSDVALVSHCLPSMRVLGSDLMQVKNITECGPRVLEHIHMCLKLYSMRNAKLIVFIEGNMQGEAQFLMNLIMSHFPYASFPSTYNPNDKVGLITNNRVKHDMAQGFSQALMSERVSIAEPFITTDPHPQALLTKIRTQLMKYSRYAKEGKDPLQSTRYTYTGKNLSMKEKDDGAIVWQMGDYAVREFFKRKEWVLYH
jgi:hypothetical protein